MQAHKEGWLWSELLMTKAAVTEAERSKQIWETIWKKSQQNLEICFTKEVRKKEELRIVWFRLLWWLRSKESACQCRRHEFNPWSRKIPHAAEQLTSCAITTESVFHSRGATSSVTTCHSYWSPQDQEPVLSTKRSHHNEKPVHHS